MSSSDSSRASPAGSPLNPAAAAPSAASPAAANPAATPPSVPAATGDGVAQLDALYQQQLRGAAAEIAAALAHAVGTPLNVISGRAELIRQDPANALAQVTRIEEQVRKMADGLRDFVEYLTSDARPSRDVPATEVLARACSLLRPVTEEQQVELLVEDEGVSSVSVDQRSLSNLVTLLSWALRCTADLHAPGQRKLRLIASPIAASLLAGSSALPAANGAVFELRVFGLPLPEHWRIERFEASAPNSESEAFRLVAVCAAIARGQGGKLQAEAFPGDGTSSGGVRLRLQCRASAA